MNYQPESGCIEWTFDERDLGLRSSNSMTLPAYCIPSYFKSSRLVLRLATTLDSGFLVYCGLSEPPYPDFVKIPTLVLRTKLQQRISSYCLLVR